MRSDAATLAFYAERAATYARTSLAHPVDDRLASFASEVPSSERILDVGCGAGRDLAAFRLAGRQAVGLDRSASLARMAADASSSSVVVADLCAAPFAPRSFAGVWASASLVHLSRLEFPNAVAELATLLAPSGSLFLSLRAGVGTVRGDDGRLFTLHSPDEVDAALAACDMHVVDRRVDAGHRRSDGWGQGWISFVAKSS